MTTTPSGLPPAHAHPAGSGPPGFPEGWVGPGATGSPDGPGGGDGTGLREADEKAVAEALALVSRAPAASARPPDAQPGPVGGDGDLDGLAVGVLG
ncbi:hypothetical protein AB0O40_12285, partial [Streptomyces sp. NPDC089919]